MSDFTKEELEALYDGLWTLMQWGWIKTNLQLNKKIQDMIDNYCDHNMKYASGEFTYCDKCGVQE